MSKVRNKKANFNAIGKLLRFAKPYVPAIFLALFFSILQIVATLFAPVIIGKTVDFIIGKDNVDFSVIAKNAGILAGLIAAVLLFQYLSSLCINFASFRTIRDLRREAFKKLNVVPLSYIDSNSHGDLMSRVGNDVDQISDGLIQGFSQLFGGIVTIVGTLDIYADVQLAYRGYRSSYLRRFPFLSRTSSQKAATTRSQNKAEKRGETFFGSCHRNDASNQRAS